MAGWGVFWISSCAAFLSGKLWLTRLGLSGWIGWPVAALASFIVGGILFGQVLRLPPIERLERAASRAGQDASPRALELIFVFLRNAAIVSILTGGKVGERAYPVLAALWYLPLAIFLLLLALNFTLRLPLVRK